MKAKRMPKAGPDRAAADLALVTREEPLGHGHGDDNLADRDDELGCPEQTEDEIPRHALGGLIVIKVTNRHRIAKRTYVDRIGVGIQRAKTGEVDAINEEEDHEDGKAGGLHDGEQNNEGHRSQRAARLLDAFH